MTNCRVKRSRVGAVLVPQGQEYSVLAAAQAEFEHEIAYVALPVLSRAYVCTFVLHPR